VSPCGQTPEDQSIYGTYTRETGKDSPFHLLFNIYYILFTFISLVTDANEDYISFICFGTHGACMRHESSDQQTQHLTALMTSTKQPQATAA
jgi:hypothetical protein